jgi:hypothetical protein
MTGRIQVGSSAHNRLLDRIKAALAAMNGYLGF